MSRRAQVLHLEAKQGSFKRGLEAVPEPGKGELLIKNGAAGLNPVDWKIQKYGVFIENYPAVLGLEAAGIIEDIGEGVTGFKYGQQVFYNGTFKNQYACFQQYTVVPAEFAAKVPKNVTINEAASIPVGIMTAAVGFYNPVEAAGWGLVAPWDGGKGKYSGTPLLVLGGASCVGQFAIQLGKLSGFSPIITTASSHNAAYLKSLGATEVVDRNSTDVAAALKKAGPFKYIYDAISLKATQDTALDASADDGLIALTLPLDESLKSKVGSRKVQAVYGNAFAHREFAIKLFGALESYLESGEIKPMKVEAVKGGLNGIVPGLERLEKGEVSNLKLIVKPQETLNP